MKKGLPLVLSLLVFLGFFYGAYLLLLTPGAALNLHVEGVILMIPAVPWWLIALIKLAREQRWGWLTGFLLCLPLAPLATLAYDMHAIREDGA